MKNNLQGNPAMLKIIVLFTCFMLVMLYNKSKAASHWPPSTYKKVSLSFNEDMTKTELSVVLKTDAPKSVKLCFYSADGKLVKEVVIKSHKETIIKNLKKGMYSYKCFDAGLNVKSGQLALQ
jgi:hypothetical protein